jgi:hypothetical protein
MIRPAERLAGLGKGLEQKSEAEKEATTEASGSRTRPRAPVAGEVHLLLCLRWPPSEGHTGVSVCGVRVGVTSSTDGVPSVFPLLPGLAAMRTSMCCCQSMRPG